MTGPLGNSEFCFPRISMFPSTPPRETLRFSGNKIHSSPRDQSLSVYYVGETTRHFSTRVREHLVTDKASHIFKHPQNSGHCRALSSVDCFHILDHASTGFQLKIKEAFHFQRQQPSLNQQLHHVNLKLSF